MLGFRKKKKEDGESKATASVLRKKGGRKVKKKKVEAYEIRVQSDLAELEKMWSDVLDFPDPGKLNKMILNLTPTDGLWEGFTHQIQIDIPHQYPIKPPKCTCVTKIWHPNIDREGHVCLNILRKDYRPVLGLNTIFIGLHFLFLEPNSDDPLNHDAAKQFDENYEAFKREAKNYMRRHAKKK